MALRPQRADQGYVLYHIRQVAPGLFLLTAGPGLDAIEGFGCELYDIDHSHRLANDRHDERSCIEGTEAQCQIVMNALIKCLLVLQASGYRMEQGIVFHRGHFPLHHFIQR